MWICRLFCERSLQYKKKSLQYHFPRFSGISSTFDLLRIYALRYHVLKQYAGSILDLRNGRYAKQRALRPFCGSVSCDIPQSSTPRFPAAFITCKCSSLAAILSKLSSTFAISPEEILLNSQGLTAHSWAGGKRERLVVSEFVE